MGVGLGGTSFPLYPASARGMNLFLLHAVSHCLCYPWSFASVFVQHSSTVCTVHAVAILYPRYVPCALYHLPIFPSLYTP